MSADLPTEGADPRCSTLPDDIWSQPDVVPVGLEAIAAVEPVRSIRAPAALHYRYTPGQAPSRFLNGMQDGRVLGERCPECRKVYVPPRGACPVDGVATSETVELGNTGTVTSFCIVNVAMGGDHIDIPFASALVLLDGADIPVFGLIQEMPHDEVRMGLRVEAVWKDESEWETSFENIKWWRPSGEDDADYETYQDYV